MNDTKVKHMQLPQARGVMGPIPAIDPGEGLRRDQSIYTLAVGGKGWNGLDSQHIPEAREGFHSI